MAGVESLETRAMLSGVPFGAMPDDTAEFMLGDVHVTVVLMESSPQTNANNNNSETWTPAAIESVKQRVTEGLQWWEDSLALKTNRHHLKYQIDFTHADEPVLTSYEPITRTSNDFQTWIYDFLNKVGYNTRGNYHSDIRAFNHAQRLAHDTDWAFTIFVVNDENDADHLFAPGGFSRAFAFAGGEFLVSLASRPASTYAHETGHIFWAYDEYRPDGNFDRSRGYYNTQNLNSWDNPTPGFVQQPSIMTKDQLLAQAYANHSSATSTFEMVGWRDSDGDGVFDVLDVPLTLSGSGAYDAATGQYRFTGQSAVQTLPNRNPSGLKNDITLNRVSRAEYRIDGEAWQTAQEFHTFSAALDLQFPVPPTAVSVEIRTIDDATGITSPRFHGSLTRPAGVLTPGINGIVWSDADGDGELDPTEKGLANVRVQLVDASGQPLPLQKTIEPDHHPSTTRLNTIEPSLTMSAVGSGVSDDTVAAVAASQTSTGGHLFASFSSSCGGYCTDWTTESRQLRLDFASPVATLSLDAIGSSAPGIARLEVFGSDNQLLARYTTRQLLTGQIETMSIHRQNPDIKYAIARSHNHTIVRFDQLRVGPQATAVTDANGAYSLSYLSGGQYRVQVVPASGQQATNPSDGSQNIVLAEGEFKGGVDFGLDTLSSPWQNPDDRFDVNDDGALTSNDVLRVINKLNSEGAGPLDAGDITPPYVDVNGDFKLTSNDVLQVINEINRRAASTPAATAGNSTGSGPTGSGPGGSGPGGSGAGSSGGAPAAPFTAGRSSSAEGEPEAFLLPAEVTGQPDTSDIISTTSVAAIGKSSPAMKSHPLLASSRSCHEPSTSETPAASTLQGTLLASVSVDLLEDEPEEDDVLEDLVHGSASSSPLDESLVSERLLGLLASSRRRG